MDSFENMCRESVYPHFITGTLPNLRLAGTQLLRTGLSTQNRRELLEKLIYFFPDDPEFYYEMARTSQNQERLLWHKICYSKKPDYFDNLFELCKILHAHGEHRQLIALNINGLFDRYMDHGDFMMIVLSSMKDAMHFRDVVKYSLSQVQTVAKTPCVTMVQKKKKFSNYMNLLEAYFLTGNVEQAMKHAFKAFELAEKFNLQREQIEVNQIRVSMHEYFLYDHIDFFSIALKINDLYPPPPIPYSFSGRPRSPRIRVGYVSSCFFLHAITNFILPILKNHDTSTFEIHLYANLTNIFDGYQSPTWQIHSIIGLSASAVADLVYRHKIDILIDLDGNTTNNSLAAFALRPAPIQMTYLGYPNTTGLKTIQYRITDSVADHMSTKQLYSEELVRLPTCFLCYDSVYQKKIYPPNPTNPNQIILSALNKEPKNTPYILDIWRRVLAACPTTILLIRLDSFDNVDGRMDHYSKHLGVAKDRLILRTKMHDEEYNQIFTQVDILLDTSPYSGTTTTCNALFNSLPVVTLYNTDYHASNVSASILKHAGIDGLIAYSADEYVDIVTALIQDVSSLDRYKRSIREKFLNLMKPSRFMPDYERILLEKYEKGLADGFL